MGEEVLGTGRGGQLCWEGGEKGRWRKVMHVLGLLWNCGWWVDTQWSRTSRTPGAHWIFNSSIGNMFSFGSFFRKTNLLTFSCIVLCAGNCFPASYGKTAAGFHDTSVKDRSLASRYIFREHQLIVTLIPCFILETSTRYILVMCIAKTNAAPNRSCFFFVEMFWKNLQRKNWWKNCTSIHTCSYVGDWWEGLIFRPLFSWGQLEETERIFCEVLLERLVGQYVRFCLAVLCRKRFFIFGLYLFLKKIWILRIWLDF